MHTVCRHSKLRKQKQKQKQNLAGDCFHNFITAYNDILKVYKWNHFYFYFPHWRGGAFVCWLVQYLISKFMRTVYTKTAGFVWFFFSEFSPMSIFSFQFSVSTPLVIPTAMHYLKNTLTIWLPPASCWDYCAVTKLLAPDSSFFESFLFTAALIIL